MNTQKTGQKVYHTQIVEIAKAASARLYTVVMLDNEYYETWKKQNPGATVKQLEERFVERNWRMCTEFARNTLTLMLTRDDVSDATKDEIMIILEQDQSIRGKRVANPPLHESH
jgi:L-rhamnose mutarotase